MSYDCRDCTHYEESTGGYICNKWGEKYSYGEEEERYEDCNGFAK